MRRRARTSPDAESVRLDGREFPVLDRLRVGGRTYLLLERLSAPPRERYRAFDPYAGPGGDQRMLLLLPRSPATRQHLAVLKRLSGETLPKVLEYRVQGDRVVLVMTWVGGIDLAEYLTGVRSGRFRRPSAFESVRLVRGLAHGLGRLHTQRLIVHGDVKPANLILATAPQRLVLIDFGSAWTSERAAERGPGDGSSAGYAAPELQTAGAAADFRSDQFSASVILYELLTLALPYDGLGGQAGRPEFRERMRGTLAPPSRDCPDRRRMPASVWQALDRLLLTGLALDPDERFPTRRAWLDAFEEVNRRLRDPLALTPVEALLALFFETLDRVLTRRR